MKIKGIEVKHIETDPIPAGLVEMEAGYEFTPYFSCKIITDDGVYRGKAATRDEAIEEAKQHFVSDMEQKVQKAIDDLNGQLFIDC